jgi:hypothetical protein
VARRNVIVQLADRRILYASGFTRLRFRLTTAEPCACAGGAASRMQRVSRAGARPQVTSVARLREPPPAMSALRVPAGQAAWAGTVPGVGKT